MNWFKWLVIAFLVILSGALFYQNTKLSRSVEVLETQVEFMRVLELTPVLKQVEETVLKEQPPEAEVKINGNSPQADLNSDETRLSDEQRLQAEIIKSLASAMLATGTLTSTIEDLELQFAEEIIDPGWSGQQKIRIQTEFANSGSMVSYRLSNLECRKTMCKGLVQSLDTQPFESYGVSIAVALSAIESIDLVKMHIRNRDANSAQVFFAKKDLIDD